MDDKTITGTPDSKLINMGENYEVEYWTKAFNINKEALADAIEAVGNSVEAVRKYLQK